MSREKEVPQSKDLSARHLEGERCASLAVLDRGAVKEVRSVARLKFLWLFATKCQPQLRRFVYGCYTVVFRFTYKSGVGKKAGSIARLKSR